jgi:nicotinate-nucleotide--dimethylbenzimidazole phosphoribosyltransferase
VYRTLGLPKLGNPQPVKSVPIPVWVRSPASRRLDQHAAIRAGLRLRSVDLTQTVAAIRPLDAVAMAAARDRQARLTKPPGSLGALEDLAVRLSGLAGQCPPPVPSNPVVAIFAGDHGVHAQGVTPWPQEVTAQMVANFQAGGAVVNAFAAQIGVRVVIVDVGVATPLPELPAGAGAGDRAGADGVADGVVASGMADGAGGGAALPRGLGHRVRAGTRDFTVEPALTRAEATEAMEVGIRVAEDLRGAGVDVLLTGDMGIANTTAAAALIACLTGAGPAAVTGRGTGIDDATLAHKVSVIAAGLDRHRPDPDDPIGVLAAFGGLEHAAIAGFVLAGAAARLPVILDGVNACAAALVAAKFAPDAVAAMVAGHRSVEPGATVALDRLGLRPLIDLDLRLGEGTGAVLAYPIVASAVRVLRDVATFDSAGVATK